MRKSASMFLICLFATVQLSAATAAEYAAAARAAAEKRDHEKAAELLEKAIELDPRNAQLHYDLGFSYGELAQNAGMLKQASLGKKAREEYERAIAIDPKHMGSRFALLTFYLFAPGIMGGGEEKAVAQAAEIRKIDAIDGHRAYGRIYAHQKKNDLARKEYVDAVREHPKSAKAHYYLGNYYLTEKNWPAALHELEMALELDASFMPTYLGIARYAARTGQQQPRGEEAARKYLTYKPADDEPNHAAAWYALGQIQEKLGKKAEARASYQNAVKIAPNDKNITDALKRVS